MNVIEVGLDHVVMTELAKKEVQTVVVLLASMDHTVTTQCAPTIVNRVNVSLKKEIHSANVLLALVVIDANTMTVITYAIVVHVALLLKALSVIVKRDTQVDVVRSLSLVLSLASLLIVRMVEHAS